MTVLLSQEDLLQDSNFQPEQTESFDGTWEDTEGQVHTKDPVALQAYEDEKDKLSETPTNVLLSQEDLEQYGGVDKTQTTAHIDETTDPLFKDDEVSMGTEFAYGFQKMPTDVENLSIYLEAKYPMPGWTSSHTRPDTEDSSFFKSVEELYGEDFTSLSEDARRDRIQQYRQDYLSREYPVLSKKEEQQDSKYDKSWSEATGSFLGMLATPTVAVPIGQTYKAAAGIGALLGFSYGVTEGLAEEGEVDWTTTGQYTGGGALLSPLMIWGGRQFATRYKTAMAGQQIKKQTKAANELLNTYDSLVYEAVHKGETNPTVIFKKLNQMLGITNDELTRAAKLAERKIHIPTQKEATLYFETIEHTAGIATKKGGAIDEYLGVLSTRIKNMNVPIWHRLRKLEYNQHARLHTNYTEVAPFLDGLSKVKGPAKNALILSLYNGKVKQVEALLKKQGNTELLAAFRATQKTLNKLHTEATDAGLTLGYKENYFPRVVKDIDGIQKHFGKDKRDEILEMIDAAAIAKGAQLSKAEQADVINQYLVGKRYFVGNKFTAFNKERKIETVTPELLKFYENPEQALHTYIRRVVSETEKKKFFGNAWEKGGLDSTDIDESIGRLLVEEKRLGNVQIGDTTELGRLLQLRFGPGEQGPAKWIQASKSMLYAQTLGNPISAVTQLGDIFLSSYKNGIKPTVQALLSKKKIKLEDYGFTDIAEEFASKTATAGFMRKTFKWGGFSRVDRLGKEVLLNSSFLKYTKEVSTPVGMKAFRKKWRKAFGDDINELAENLRAGNSDNEQVRLLLWHDLSDMQPISLSEMPAKYLSSPDGRALYMLKTFTIKQFDIMRRDAFKLLANKETRAEGVKNLIKYATIFTAGNMTSDSIKSWMLGRDYDIEDSALNSIWRLAGLSKYSGEKLGDKPLDVTWDLAKPPLNIWGDMLSAAQDALDFDSETEASNKWVKGIPVVGKPMYEHFLGGKEEYAEKADKKRRGFRRGGIVAQAERLGFNKGGEVSLDNTSNSLISKESQILVDNETVPFVDRIINPQDYPYPEDNKDGSISTHLLSVEVDEDGSAYVFPTKVYQDKGYKTYTNDERFKALDDAKSSGNTIKFDTIDEAVNFSKNYKTENFKKYYRRKPLVDDMEDNIDTVLTTPSDIGDAWGKRALMMQDTFKRARNNEINALLFAGHIAGDIAGGVWDTMGEAGEAVIDTARVNARYSFPDVYESLANKLSDDGKKLLDTTIVKKGLKKAGDLFTWYRDDFKKNNPIEAKSLEATGNLLPLAFLKPLLKKTGTLNNQMDDVLEGEVLPPVSTYKYKSNSDTPHLDVRNTERYQYLGNATTTKINEVNKFFNPDVLNKALQGTDKNTKVVYMLPGNFLTLAKTHTSGVETKKLDRINKAIDENIQLEDIPTLTIKAGTGGGSQVIKHDGRHRVNALENLGLDLIPVRIIIEGNTSGKRIETVTNEDGLEVYSFPNASVYNRTHYGEAAIIQQADKLFKNIVVEDFDTSILIGSKEKASNGLPSAYIELDKTGEWNTWVVNDVMVEGKYLNQKVGKRMYLRAIEEALENKVDYIDSDGLMSSDSIRVWEGLKMTSPREIERLGFGHLNGMFTVRGSTAGNIEHKEKKGGSTYEQAEDDAMFQIELNSALYHDKKPKAAMPAKKTKDPTLTIKVDDKQQSLERAPVGMGLEQMANDNIALVGGLRSGNSKGDETRLKYTVYDYKAIQANNDMDNANDYILGDVELFVEDGTGKVRGLVELNIKDKRKGTGRKVIEALMASDFVNDDFNIHSIKKSAIPFWEKMGIEFNNKRTIGDYRGDGILRKEDSVKKTKATMPAKKTQDPALIVKLDKEPQNLALLTKEDIDLANKPFNKERLAQYTKYNSQELSEEKMLYLSPKDFLSLSAPLALKNNKVDGYYRRKFEKGDEVEVPYLNVVYDANKGTARIVGHEGRHRAHTLNDQGTKLIPVRFRMVGREGERFEDVWWKDLGNMKTELGLDIKKYPHRLFNERGTASYSFPISKNRVGDDNIRFELKNKTEFTAGRMSFTDNETQLLKDMKNKRLDLQNKRLELQKMIATATEDDWEWLGTTPQKDWHIYWDKDTESFNFPEVSSTPPPKEIENIISLAKKTIKPKVIDSFKDLKKGDVVETYHATPASEIVGGKFEIRKDAVHGGSGFPRGIHSAPQIKNTSLHLDSGEFGDNIFKLETTIKGDIWDVMNPDPKLVDKLQKAVGKKYGDSSHPHHTYLNTKIANGTIPPQLGREFLLENGIDTVRDGSERLISLNPDNVKVISKVGEPSAIVKSFEKDLKTVGTNPNKTAEESKLRFYLDQGEGKRMVVLDGVTKEGYKVTVAGSGKKGVPISKERFHHLLETGELTKSYRRGGLVTQMKALIPNG